MEKDRMLRLAVIAGASEALKYKEKNPTASESQIINHVSKSAREIAENIDGED